MKRIFSILCALVLIVPAANAEDHRKPVKITRENVDLNVLRAQILLDRASYSPGEIDALYGPNLRAAVHGFQAVHQLSTNGELGPETLDVLNADTAPVLITYEISQEDVEGPFQPIPDDMKEKSTLQSLGYQSPLELLSEKFHVSPKVLTLLNKGKAFDRAGERILVPNVGSPTEPVRKAASILVRKRDMTVSALDERGMVVAQFPASAGSEHDPLPIGEWKIQGVAKNPPFHYNPQLFWDAAPEDSAATIAPGPNNPADTKRPTFSRRGAHRCLRLTTASSGNCF